MAFPQPAICWRSFHIHLRGFFSSSITAHVAAAAASATSAPMCKYREGQHSSHRPRRAGRPDLSYPWMQSDHVAVGILARAMQSMAIRGSIAHNRRDRRLCSHRQRTCYARRNPCGCWAEITPAPGVSASRFSACKLQAWMPTAAWGGFQFLDSHEDGAAGLVGRMVGLEDRWSSAPRVVAASSIRDC